MRGALEWLYNSNPSKALWLLGGSSSLLAQGVKLERAPQDLDLYADEPDAIALQGCWSEWSTDKPEWSVTAMYRSLLSHYLVDGFAVELVGNFTVKQDWCCYETAIHSALWKHRAEWCMDGVTVPLTPLSHELVFNLLRGRDDRTQAIADRMELHSDQHADALRTVLNQCEPKEYISGKLLKLVPKTIALV